VSVTQFRTTAAGLPQILGGFQTNIQFIRIPHLALDVDDVRIAVGAKHFGSRISTKALSANSRINFGDSIHRLQSKINRRTTECQKHFYRFTHSMSEMVQAQLLR